MAGSTVALGEHGSPPRDPTGGGDGRAPLPVLGPARRAFGRTQRRDAWWLQPLLVLLVFSAFIVYTTWASFEGAHYRYGPYLSPLYSPELFGDPEHAWFGAKPAWWPGWLPFSAAFLILWAPGGFRLTCYYYRGAYYKAFWADPPACTVGEPRKSYRGEASFPLVLQNVHRWFLYLALLFLVFLAWDVWEALWFTDPHTGGTSFGIGVGTLVLAVNTALLAGYTFGCHSLRHLVGGGIDLLSGRPLRWQAYRCVGCFNRAHGRWAWASLVWVGFADVYVRLCAMGVWTDWRLL
jgi:hypothetical protein